MKRRGFLKGMVVIGGLAALGEPVFAVPKKVRIGVLAPSHCALPLAYAPGGGFFSRRGVSAELVFAEKIEDIVKGLATGDLAFGQITTPLAFAISAGNPKLPKMQLAATQILGTNGGILAVSTKTDVSKITHLKGKRIGVHSPFIMHSLILNLLMEKSGMDPAKDIEVKIIPMNEMATAIKESTVDGVINPEPLPTMLESKGLARTVLNTKMFWVDHPCCALTMKSTMLTSEKELVRNVTVASMEAGLTLDNRSLRPKAIAAVHASTPAYQQIPLALLLQAFSVERSDFYPFPFRSAGLVAVNQMKKQGLLKSDVDSGKLVANVFASEFALEALKEAAKSMAGASVPADIDREERFRISAI